MVNCFVFVGVLLIGLVSRVSPSAIPMWEYLTVDEKVSAGSL